MKEKVQEMLLKALEKELAVEGDDIRTYLIETLARTIMELEEEEAPQVQTEEPGSFLDLESNQRFADFVKKSILEDIKNGVQIIPEKTKFSPL